MLKIILLLSLIPVYSYYVVLRYRKIMIDSDFCNLILEANDILHGNFFLNDWQLTGLTFITTDLPYYVLTTFFFGVTVKSYVYASALMFLVFLCSCYLLIKDIVSEDNLCKVLFICIVCFPSDFAFMGMRSHTADVTLALLGLYVICNGGKKNRTLKGHSAFLAWLLFTLAVTGDSLCIPFVILPILCISLVNSIGNYVNNTALQKDDAIICVIALLSVAAGKILEKLYFVLGTASKNSFLETKNFIALGQVYSKLVLYLQSLLKLFNADYTGTRLFSYEVVFYFLGVLVVVICLYSVMWNICNYFRGREYDCISVSLSLGFLLVSVLCVITNIYVDLMGTRYYATAPGILCVIILRTFSISVKPHLPVMKLQRITTVLSLFLIIFACHQLFPLPDKSYKADPSVVSLINTLRNNSLSQGYSGFWAASSSTVYSQNRIRIRAIRKEKSKLAQYKWFCKNEWYNDESSFIVVKKDGKGDFFTKSDVVKSFGKPAKILLSAPYLIYVYDKDISKMIVK